MLKNIEDKDAKVNEADKQLLGILKSTNRNRRIITVIVLVTFMLIMIGIGVAYLVKLPWHPNGRKFYSWY